MLVQSRQCDGTVIKLALGDQFAQIAVSGEIRSQEQQL